MNKPEIDSPSYYQLPEPAYEIADITVHLPHAVGAAIEYLYRAGRKTEDQITDLEKARWWIARQLLLCGKRKKKENSEVIESLSE